MMRWTGCCKWCAKNDERTQDKTDRCIGPSALSPIDTIGVVLPGPHDEYMRDSLLSLAGHGDGHIVTVAVALLLAILTGRSDLCIAGVFGAGKTRSLTVLLIALSCELSDFYAIVYTKENVAAKA